MLRLVVVPTHTRLVSTGAEHKPEVLKPISRDTAELKMGLWIPGL